MKNLRLQPDWERIFRLAAGPYASCTSERVIRNMWRLGGDQPDSGGPAQLSAPSLRSPRFSRTLTDADLSPDADSAVSVREQRSHDHQLSRTVPQKQKPSACKQNNSQTNSNERCLQSFSQINVNLSEESILTVSLWTLFRCKTERPSWY